MKQIYLITFLLIAMGFMSCNKDKSNDKPLPEGMHQALVNETMNSGGYTYLRVNESGKELWLAAPIIKIQKGDKVYYSGVTEMKNFHSKTLEKTFETIIFVDQITKNPWKSESKSDDMAEMEANPHKNTMTKKKQDISIEPLKNGYTIDKIYADKESLKGKTIQIKGQVVKFNPSILNTNWVHIQDGSGNDNTCDLVITTQEFFNVGDVVVFEGTVVTDKDLGSGYKFPLMLEKAHTKKADKKS